MSTNYEVRESYDRKLSILKRKIVGLKNSPSKEPPHLKDQFSITQQEILSEDNAAHLKKDGKDGYINQFSSRKSQAFIKLFVSQLKKNHANIQSEVRVDSNQMTREIDSLYGMSYRGEGKGWMGIKSRKSIELLVSIMTVLAILLLHFLSTFQCLFEDYRTEVSEEIKGIKYACFCFTVIKIGSSLLLITTVLGKKLQYISQISLHYVTTIDFYLDMFALASAILLIALPHNEYSAIFAFISTIMNVAYIDRMETAIDIYYINNNTKKQIFAVFKLLLANFFIVHFMATLLLGLSLLQNNSNWLDRYGISESEWWIKYTYGLYWSASIMATVGFGDIVVNNYVEAACLTVIILVGCLILSYNIAQVGNIINNLKQMPEEVKHQLSVLKRLAAVAKIDQNLHHSIGEYIIHSAEIKKSFELKERMELIAMLPSQMREEFIEQNSRNFCASIPFLFMLQNETQKLAVSKMQLQVLSPNEYITHKKLGLTRICILRKGVIGLAYKKKGSRLNGVILDTISIMHERDDPQMLNTYLLIRGKKLIYDIICQEYCVVGCLEFSDFMDAIRESDKDFELYHQSRDEAIFRINQWDKKKCKYCDVRHSLFVCPKMHYIPIRSQTFLKSQRSNASNIQRRPKFKYQRKKVLVAKYNPTKLWKRFFSQVQNVLQTNVQKSQLMRVIKTVSTDEDILKEERQSKYTKMIIEQYFAKYNNEKPNLFELDILKDYKFYFNKHNPSELVEVTLDKNFHPIVIERLRSCY